MSNKKNQPKRKKNTSARKTKTSFFQSLVSKLKGDDADDFGKKKWGFFLLFSVLLFAFLFFYNSVVYEQNFLMSVNRFESRIASFVLNIFGFETSVEGISLRNAQTSVSIARGCDGIEPLLLYVLAVLVVPLPRKTKLPGLLIGITSLFVLNIFRVIGLFLTSIYFPEAFDFLHVHGGYIIFISITILLFLLWLNWALKKRQEMAMPLD